MTEPERPADSLPSGSPSPEEISARLEALLKRTHSLRAQRASGADATPNMTWPPPDRELDHYDVVDVQEGASTAVHAAPTTPSREGDQAPASATKPAADAAGFARPDWSELRLRAPGDEPPPRSPWLWVLTSLLALATVGQAAYIWQVHAARPAQESGRLRVDGPGGAEVRVDGQAIGAAPVDHALDPGTYAVEVVLPEGRTRVETVTLGPGRTVVLLLPRVPETVTAPVPTTTVPSGQPAQEPPAPDQPPAPAVSATTGVVVIESTPPGLPVTMGGRPRGLTPVTIGQVRPGRHDVLVGGTARQVDVVAGEVATLRVP